MGKSSLSGKLSNEGIINFCDSIIPLLSSGVKIDVALYSVAGGSTLEFSQVLKEVSSMINSGVTFTAALAKYPGYFSQLFIELVSVGEQTGRVDLQLEKIRKIATKEQKFQESMEEIFRPIRVIVIVIVGLFLLNITFISPFVYKMIGGRSRGGLKTYFTFTMFLNKFWYLVLFAFVAFIVFLITRSIGSLKSNGSLLALLIPGLSKIEYNSDRARFFLTMSNLMEAGIGIRETIKSSALASNSEEILSGAQYILGLIESGQGLANSFRRTQLFEYNILTIIEAAEQSGSYGKSFENCSEHYDKNVEKCLSKTMHSTKLVTFFVFGGAFFINMGLILGPILAASGI